MKVKAKCARALIRYLKAKGSERENSNELCTTKLYYATCRQRVCGQNKDNLCLQAARTLRAKRTLIWRSYAFNRGPMTMPVLDGVKPMAITLPICGTSESLFWKKKKSIYCWTRSRPTWTFGESDDQVRDKSESKYQRDQDKSETIEKRLESGLESETGLEYYSPNQKCRKPATSLLGVSVISGDHCRFSVLLHHMSLIKVSRALSDASEHFDCLVSWTSRSFEMQLC